MAYLRDLDPGKPQRFTLLERDLVLWWDGVNSTWRAFNDVCPHRLVPLSEGRINAAGDLDSLTGVLSRQALIQGSARIFGKRMCTGKDVGVFYVDIDNFKEINDRHGHNFGDRYLRHVAGAIGAHIRKSDLVGRMGGMYYDRASGKAVFETNDLTKWEVRLEDSWLARYLPQEA